MFATAQSKELVLSLAEMHSGVRRLNSRLRDVRAFEPDEIADPQDPKIRALEALIKETLADVFGPNSRTFRSFAPAATLGLNANGTLLGEVIEGLVRGKDRSITLLEQVVRLLEERIEEFNGPVAPSGFPDPGEMRPHGPATTPDRMPFDTIATEGTPVAGTAPQPIVTEITSDALALESSRSTVEGRFELLMARVAALEATLILRPQIPGPGHNRGPDLEDDLEVDEAGIQHLVALLKEQRPTAPVDLPALIEAAKVADPAANKWRERLDEFAKGVLKGAGTVAGAEIVEKLQPASWFGAVYSALEAVYHALILWI
jgi:hypothetical protein